MTIIEWFNPADIKHIWAWRELERTGRWPKNFIPFDIDIEVSHALFEIMAKIANCWIVKMLDGKCLVCKGKGLDPVQDVIGLTKVCRKCGGSGREI